MTTFRIALPLLPAALVAILVAACTESAPPRFSGTLDADSLFLASVEPVLRDQCESCHFLGGDMYASFPFDSRAAVEARAGEIAERLEGHGRLVMDAWMLWTREQTTP